jgi:quercetin dioxygenase-like cupin family protein
MKSRVVHVTEASKHNFDWGTITWLHSGASSGSEELTLGEVVIKSGCANPMHSHSNCEEALYLLEGELQHSCGDEPSYLLQPGSAIVIQRGIPHNAKCISDCDAKMVAAYSSPAREMQGE